MGNRDISNSEDILIKVDQNNLIYIDPNSVIVDGEIETRGIKQEELVMFVNLQADLIPRSILSTDNQQSTLVSIAKGNVNFLKNNNGGDYDTSWTNAYNGTDEKTLVFNQDPNFVGPSIPTSRTTVNNTLNDSTGQSFGIESISITTKGFNAIPQVTINFIDVRGKTLFESPQDSPYKAFFHLPWPIFYLTIKGYYGKAIKYRLHLVKFNTKFNESNGNFEVTTNFVGSTYAYLNDIPLQGILNAPYMYMVEFVNNNSKFNTNTGNYEVAISKSSRGYQILESVYKEYKQKGLIDKNFPVKTLREVIVVAESLDRILEREIFNELVDMEIFVGVVEYEKSLLEFSQQVNSWANAYLSKEYFYKNDNNTGSSIDIFFYPLGPDKTTTKNILGEDNGTIEKIIKNNIEKLNNTSGFATDIVKKENKKNLKSGAANFSSINAGNYIRVNKINEYIANTDGNKVGFNINLLKNHIQKLANDFSKQKEILQKEVEERINTIVRDPKLGIGFEPTIRNIFAVVLANADVYIRLLKDVHTRAFDQGRERKDKLGGLHDETPGVGAIYPWPEVKKSSGENKSTKILAYPGDPELQSRLQSNDYKLWPEVEFLENYQAVATKKYDTLTNKEGGIGKINFIFQDNFLENKFKKISTLDEIANNNQYVSKTLAPFLYEIYERSFYSTFFDTFNDDSVVELSNLEYKTIQEFIKEDNDLIDILKGYVTTIESLYDKLKGTSPFERWPYLQDSLPTTPYIKDIIDNPFTFEQYIENANRTSTDVTKSILVNAASNNVFKIPKFNNNDDYPKLNDNLRNYTPESYRKNIYPFNSNLYLDYLNQQDYTDNELKFNGALKIDTLNGFITSPLTNEWFKEEFKTNIFKNKFFINQSDQINLLQRTTSTNKTFTNILNTPYFHKQLYSDFFNNQSLGKYAGSAYLLLNSLPYYDLEETIPNILPNNIKLSSIYREIGATHFIPYHLLLKWGSIYHRYKRYLVDNVDILSPILSTNNQTTNINTGLFFDNNNNIVFTVSGSTTGYTVNRLLFQDVGIHPYYDAIFHQVVNGYNHYDVISGNTSFYQNTSAGAIRESVRSSFTGIKYWTSFVDNSKFDPKDNFYTILPSDGYLSTNSFNNNDFSHLEQMTFRIVWDNDTIYHDFSGYTFPSYGDYHRTYSSGSTEDNVYGLGNDYRKIIDLIGTFSPSILSQMEDMFISFASELTNEEIPYKIYDKVKYYQFQELLKDIVTVKKEPGDPTDEIQLIEKIKERQQVKLSGVTNNLKSYDNLIQFTNANPKELDPYVLINFSKSNISDSTFNYQPYDSGALTQQNRNFIELYLGEDVDNKYLEFFTVNDVELSEDNILQFRPLIYVYAGKYKNNTNATHSDFINYLKTDVVKIDSTTKLTLRQNLFLRNLLSQFPNLQSSNNIKKLTPTVGFGDTTLKLELYNFFKSFNDKWVAGNSLGQRLLLEEFLFLDKANKDIGNDAYFNIQKLIPLDDPNNQKQTLYGVISILLERTGFYMRALPAYVNFYGTNFTNKAKPIPSKNVAKNLFGTFLDVDYVDSYPRMLVQYTGPTSKHLDLSSINKDFRFNDDSFDVSKQNNNPLIITSPKVFSNGELYKSNRVVAFEVSFGDQNQSIFKGIQLDQASIKNTTESMIALENLARSESGSNAYQVDIGLYDIFRQASYTCTVSCMGNVMIQPTMYFYLKNIPMFKGTYWITDVSHSIRNNTISTTFTGTRMPNGSLPDPKESFMATYRPLFDAITNKAVAKLNQISNKTSTEQVLQLSNGGSVLVDTSGKTINGEKLINEDGMDEYRFSYNGRNGEKYIQKVSNTKFNNSKGSTWYRALVVRMGGKNYSIEDTKPMSLPLRSNPSTKIIWSDIKDNSEVFSLRFDIPQGSAQFVMDTKTTFVKADSDNKPYVLNSEYNYTSNPKVLKGPINIGPLETIGKYGIAMNETLMNKLGVVDGDVVYFFMEKK